MQSRYVLLSDVFLFHACALIISVLSLASDLNKLRAQMLVRCDNVRSNCFGLCTNISRNNVPT